MIRIRSVCARPRAALQRRAMAAIPAILGTPEKLNSRLPLAKIVATIGPVSEQSGPMKQVFDAGMRIMRINFSHATYEEAGLRVRNLNACRAVCGQGNDVNGVHTNMRAVMLDTQGPEIRTGSFDGVKNVQLKAGQTIVVTTDETFRAKQTADKIWISYKKLADTVTEGSQLLVDDGLVELKVVGRQGGDIVCTVQNNAVLGNKKGAFMPGLVVDLPAMSEKDKADITWGVENDIDYIAASFVRKPSDVTEIRDFCAELLRGQRGRPLPRIISKIESTEALLNFDEILAVSDGVMVARGDLAVEIPMESLACVQKEIVHRCNAAGKPVIVATQMLDSMQSNPRPTRAEASDVANAIFDGADCVMLSGESANGKYPVASVDTMQRIVHQAELGLRHQVANPKPLMTPATEDLCSVRALAFAAVQVAGAGKDVAAIVVDVAESAGNPQEPDATLVTTLSALRPHVPVICLVPTYKAGRLLQMFRGVHPVLSAPAGLGARYPAALRQELQRLGLISASEAIVCLRGSSTASATLQIATCAH